MSEEFDMLDMSKCPTCGQTVKTYKRKLYGDMAYRLILLSKLPDGFHHISEIGMRSGGKDFAKLRYWGLIEEKPNKDDPTKRTSGFWKITDRGRDFVEGKVKLSIYCYVYNKEVQTFSSEMGSIKDALGKKFDYSELMSGA